MTAGLAELPKALLHDHLDGGLRVSTVLELAEDVGYEHLPATEPSALAAWFHQGESGSLEKYLEAFVHTTAVMQTAPALERVAYEAVLDLAADGVRYAEVRFAPTLHVARGLEPTEVLAAVAAGIHAGEAETGCVTRLIIDAMRQMHDSEAVAKLAVTGRDLGVVGFDLAGPEAGFPNGRYRAACDLVDDANLPVTVHAGEGDGTSQIWQALHQCDAKRIGHGVRIIEDTTVTDGTITDLGPLAAYVRDLRVPLEVSVLSNLHTGIYPTPEAHPVGLLYRGGFAVTINTDNRLMSGTSMTTEFQLLADHHGFAIEDFHAVTRTALEAGFGEWSERRRLIGEVDSAYRDLGSNL
jgi:adenosine deaminase